MDKMTCGSCKYFAYRVKNGKLKKWGGRCDNHSRSDYHDASQKACKLYQYMTEENDEKRKRDNPTKTNEDG